MSDCTARGCLEEPAPGFKQCDRHLRLHRRDVKRHGIIKRSLGFCPFGGCYVVPRGGHTYCAKHRKYFRERSRKIRAAAKFVHVNKGGEHDGR